MRNRRLTMGIWIGVALVIAAILLPVYRPLRTAWLCYRLHDAKPREVARVREKLADSERLVLQIEAGPHAGESCTAGPFASAFDRAAPGDALEVVYVEGKGGTCELSSTIVASRWVVAGLAMLVGLAIAGVLAAGVFLQRTFTKPQWPVRRFEVSDDEPVRCPACGKPMDEGYAPILAGIHWRKLGEPVGLPHALGGLPGTVGWRGRPRLHAFRCVPCEILTLQYGTADRRSKGA